MTIADDRTSKAKRKREASIEFRRAVLALAKIPGGWKCERCGMPYRYESSIHAHHRLPRSQGGSNCVTNGCCVCGKCHGIIHDRGTDEHGYGGDWIVTRNTLRIPPKGV